MPCKFKKKNGYLIPEHIAFVGFTESQMATIIEPPLTSVIQPANQIGKQAANILIEQIESQNILNPNNNA